MRSWWRWVQVQLRSVPELFAAATSRASSSGIASAISHTPGTDSAHAMMPQFSAPIGGAWVYGDKREQGLPLAGELVGRGWVFVTVNYRLGPRFRFPAQLVDAKRAIAWVHERIGSFGGDPSFVAVAGGSAGGHLAALAALSPGDPEYQPGFEGADTTVAACVPFYGVYDLTGERGPAVTSGTTAQASRRRRSRDAGLVWFLERCVMAALLADDPGAYLRASPTYRVRRDAPPFLVVHGANDTLVPVEAARRFVAALRSVSEVPVTYLELPRTQHAFDVMWSQSNQAVVEGVARHLESIREWRKRQPFTRQQAPQG